MKPGVERSGTPGSLMFHPQTRETGDGKPIVFPRGFSVTPCRGLFASRGAQTRSSAALHSGLYSVAPFGRWDAGQTLLGHVG